MVHNGIEYADMQLIAEAYDLLREALGLGAQELAEIFEDWNQGDLDSFLIEITGKVLRQTDAATGRIQIAILPGTWREVILPALRAVVTVRIGPACNKHCRRRRGGAVVSAQPFHHCGYGTAGPRREVIAGGDEVNQSPIAVHQQSLIRPTLTNAPLS
jgi:hypothetical protein